MLMKVAVSVNASFTSCTHSCSNLNVEIAVGVQSSRVIPGLPRLGGAGPSCPTEQRMRLRHKVAVLHPHGHRVSANAMLPFRCCLIPLRAFNAQYGGDFFNGRVGVKPL